MHLEHAWAVRGEPAPRRTRLPLLADDDSAATEYTAWYIDARGAAVAALWREGVLWLGGAAVYAIADDMQVLPFVAGGPPHGVSLADPRWTRVAPEPGIRYVATTDTSVAPGRDRGLARAALAAALVAGGRGPGAALVLDAVASAAPIGLVEYVESLRASGMDLSWTGNEGGPGLLHTFARARRPGASVRDLLREHARHDEVLAGRIGEHASVWLSDQVGAIPRAGLLVADEPERGYWHDVSITAFSEGVRGSAGAWLDPGTAHARLAYARRLPGPALVEALRARVDELTVACLTSGPDPDEAVVGCHLVGGVDRRSGEVVGFVLERIWT